MLTWLVNRFEKRLETRKKATRFILRFISLLSLAVTVLAWFIGVMVDFFWENPFLSILPGVATWIGLVGAFWLQGLVDIPARPIPHRGILLRLRKRLAENEGGEILGEGLRFLPLRGILFDVELLEYQTWTLNLRDEKHAGQLVRTLDLAESEVPIVIVGRMSEFIEEKGPSGELVRRKSVDALIAYDNTGGKEGFQAILHARVADRLRQWAAEKKTWPELVFSMGEATERLWSAVAGKALDKNELENAMEPNGSLILSRYGGEILEVAVGEIEPTGELRKAAERQAVEASELPGDVIEVKNLVGLANIVGEGLDVSDELALEAGQLIQSKGQGDFTKTVTRSDASFRPGRGRRSGFLRRLFDGNRS